MATYRQIVNRVLQVVGEDEVEDIATELDEDYHKLVGSFVNLIKEEVEDAANWRTLWHTEAALTLTANTNSLTVTNTTDRSRLVRLHDQMTGQVIPLVFDVTQTTNVASLQEISLSEMFYRQTVQTQTTSGSPQFVAIDDTTASTLTLRFHPTPTANRTIKVTACTPQAFLDDDDLDTSILIPSRALLLGAVWWALQEKGEELGQGSVFTEERYRNALDTEVTREVEEQGGLQLVVV